MEAAVEGWAYSCFLTKKWALLYSWRPRNLAVLASRTFAPTNDEDDNDQNGWKNKRNAVVGQIDTMPDDIVDVISGEDGRDHEPKNDDSFHDIPFERRRLK